MVEGSLKPHPHECEFGRDCMGSWMGFCVPHAIMHRHWFEGWNVAFNIASYRAGGWRRCTHYLCNWLMGLEWRLRP